MKFHPYLKKYIFRTCICWALLFASGIGNCIFAHTLSRQAEGANPFITSYLPRDYGANGQNWAFAQDSAGVMYAANSGGVVLQFDGRHWTQLPVGNKSIVRSLRYANSGFWVGLQNDFGFLGGLDRPQPTFVSFVNRLPAAQRRFGDIWQIVTVSNGVYFLERNQLFFIPAAAEVNSLAEISILPAQTRFHNIFKLSDERVLVQQPQVGLMQVQDTRLSLLPGGAFFKDDLLAGVLIYSPDTLLVATRQRGLFLVSGDGDIHPMSADCQNLLTSAHLYQLYRLSDGTLAIATKYAGLLLLNANGELLQRIDDQSGLASNTVWAVFEDRAGDIWLALNEGLAQIHRSQPFVQIGRAQGLKGSVHGIQRFGNSLYVTSSYGLWRSRTNAGDGRLLFEQVRGINTSGWGMLEALGQLLISANSGIYRLQQGRAVLLKSCDPWGLFSSLSDPRRLYIGLAKGVTSLRLGDDGKIVDEGRIPGINMEARTVAETQDGELWVASSFQGVQKTTGLPRYFSQGIVPTVQDFGADDGIPGKVATLLFHFGREVLFSTANGIYKFNIITKRFEPAPQFQKLNDLKLGDSLYMLSRAQGDDRIWTHIGPRLVLAKRNTSGNFMPNDSLLRGLPEIQLQYIYPDVDGTIWFGHRKGIIGYLGQKETSVHRMETTLLRGVLQDGQRQAPGSRGQKEGWTTRTTYKAAQVWRFIFALPVFTRPEQTVFHFRLLGFDAAWSEWTLESQKDYTNLPPGTYRFQVEARDVFGQVHPPAEYGFSIAPLWYQSRWTWFGSLFLVLVGLLLAGRWLVKWSRKRTLLEHQREEAQRRATEELIRSQVAADFHDELGTRITRISLFSEILKTDIEQASETTKVYLEKISKNADRLYDETRDFIWQLDPQKDTLADFIARMKSFGDELFEETDILFNLNWKILKPAELKLKMDIRRNLIRIFKEAMHNALKYSKCKNVLFEVSHDNNRLHFSLSDDGIGFSPGRESDGIGLKTMKTRAENINAAYTIDSASNKGTHIELSILL